MTDKYYKLDNPAWHALTETHAGFAIGNDEVKRYQPDIVAFAAYRHGSSDVFQQLADLIDMDESFFIIGDLPELTSNYVIESILPCAQMTCSTEIKTLITATIEKMEDENEEEMTALINLVQPGYYKPGTRLMGEYVGIRQDGQLVALAGERMRMNGLTEISAVVTHPGFTGRKYAQQLITQLVNKNIAAGMNLFLHVLETNTRAISVYEYLGFSKRRTINFTKIKRTA